MSQVEPETNDPQAPSRIAALVGDPSAARAVFTALVTRAAREILQTSAQSTTRAAARRTFSVHSVRSHPFEIAEDVYDKVLKTALRMFYFNRANFEKKKPFACQGERCWLQGADNVGPHQDTEARSVSVTSFSGGCVRVSSVETSASG